MLYENDCLKYYERINQFDLTSSLLLVPKSSNYFSKTNTKHMSKCFMRKT